MTSATTKIKSHKNGLFVNPNIKKRGGAKYVDKKVTSGGNTTKKRKQGNNKTKKKCGGADDVNAAGENTDMGIMRNVNIMGSKIDTLVKGLKSHPKTGIPCKTVNQCMTEDEQTQQLNGEIGSKLKCYKRDDSDKGVCRTDNIKGKAMNSIANISNNMLDNLNTGFTVFFEGNSPNKDDINKKIQAKMDKLKDICSATEEVVALYTRGNEKHCLLYNKENGKMDTKIIKENGNDAEAEAEDEEEDEAEAEDEDEAEAEAEVEVEVEVEVEEEAEEEEEGEEKGEAEGEEKK